MVPMMAVIFVLLVVVMLVVVVAVAVAVAVMMTCALFHLREELLQQRYVNHTNAAHRAAQGNVIVFVIRGQGGEIMLQFGSHPPLE